MNSERTRIWIGFVIISLVWGSTWLAIKIGLASVPPFFAAGIRFLIASAVLYVILRLRGLSIILTPETIKLYAALIFLSYSIPFALVYWGMQYIPSGLSSILFSAYPFSVAIFSHLLLAKERLTWFKIAGIVFGFVGIVIIFSGDVHWTETAGVLGMACILVSTVMQALAVVLIKKYGQPISPFVMNFVGMLGGGVILGTLGLATESFSEIVWDTAAVGSILYLAIIGSVLAFVTYHWLLKRIEAVYLSLVSFINPIVAVVLGAIILRETLAPSVLIGASCVLVGILVANGKQIVGRIFNHS
ncbi:MAG: Multidrug transporter permease [Bacteroidetes bacterium]|nr:Multidrug transporter permease [Bacteroidota bacterium]